MKYSASLQSGFMKEVKKNMLQEYTNIDFLTLSINLMTLKSDFEAKKNSLKRKNLNFFESQLKNKNFEQKCLHINFQVCTLYFFSLFEFLENILKFRKLSCT